LKPVRILRNFYELIAYDLEIKDDKQKFYISLLAHQGGHMGIKEKIENNPAYNSMALINPKEIGDLLK